MKLCNFVGKEIMVRFTTGKVVSRIKGTLEEGSPLTWVVSDGDSFIAWPQHSVANFDEDYLKHKGIHCFHIFN